MPFEFASLLENLNLTTPMLIDAKGEEVSTVESLKAFHDFYKGRQEKGLIPKYYKKPLGCQLELTYRCNQFCKTCYNRSGGERNTWESLSKDEWLAVVDELVDIGLFQCVISGGEPLLMGDSLFEIMDRLHEARIKFVFITNGMLVTPEIVEKLSKYRFDWLQVSIDGSRPEIHDDIRGTKSWHKAIRAASLVHEAGIPLVIAHVIAKQNFDYLDEMVDMAYFLGANQIIIGPVEYSGRATENYGELALTADQRESLYRKFKSKYCQYANRMAVKITLDEVMTFRYRMVENNGVLLIRPNGDVKFDCILPYVIGNIRKQSIQAIWDEIGHNVYEHPTVQECVRKLKSEEDVLKYLPDIDSERIYLKSWK